MSELKTKRWLKGEIKVAIDGGNIWTEFIGRGFESYSGQLYVATSKKKITEMIFNLMSWNLRTEQKIFVNNCFWTF